MHAHPARILPLVRNRRAQGTSYLLSHLFALVFAIVVVVEPADCSDSAPSFFKQERLGIRPDKSESDCMCAPAQGDYAVIGSEDVLFSFVAQIGMEHWLYDGFQVGEPYTFTFNTYNPILGVQVDDQSVLSQAGT